jgi:Tfp pilus assembly protein PilV
MIRNNKGETIVGILIGVFIVSIVILGIASLINYSRVTIQSYDRSTKIAILRENLTNIIQAINLD